MGLECWGWWVLPGSAMGLYWRASWSVTRVGWREPFGDFLSFPMMIFLGFWGSGRKRKAGGFGGCGRLPGGGIRNF